MSEIMTPGAPTGIPAGYAQQSVAGGFPTILLTANVGAADILELTGALTIQNVIVQIPIAAFPTQVLGSNLGGSYSGPTTSGWMKIIKNSSVSTGLPGTQGVFVQIVGGSNSVQIPQGETVWVYSPDGVRVFLGSGAAGSGAPLAVYVTQSAVDTVGAGAVPVALPGAVVTANFLGSRILIESTFVGESAGVAGFTPGPTISVLVDGVTLPFPNNKVAQTTSPGATFPVGGAISWNLGNLPDTLHTIQLLLNGGASAASIKALSNTDEYVTLTVYDLP
jgi:hypothetical protein